MKTRHFLRFTDVSESELKALLVRAAELKVMQKRGEMYAPLVHKMMAMVFEKSSTRTRVSFQAGMTQLGGQSMFLTLADSQLGRGEPVEDTARVLSRMVDVVVVRTTQHERIETFATHSDVPVINALTDRFHPCQLLADIQTFIEHRGDIRGRTAAWVGDGNNVCQSWIEAACMLDFSLNIACPQGDEPDLSLHADAAKHVRVIHDPKVAVENADIVITDTWASMGQEEEKAKRKRDFAGYMVNEKLMSLAKKDAIFMHCLPAYRGSEVSTEVLEGKQSVVWDEAENRLHAQKALLEFLMVKKT